ncbi:C40 family peptidase [Arthrobacter castelli]|uniref:C40 family peptidase n=1 Tax=Arthrobacter castelli TaxID=271431 RepID=UPI0003FB0751|nr:C40 family peptidase [Arthrobacter castelli]
MSSSAAAGRHRAAGVRRNPLANISRAVSSNAGSVGRQAAVIAAASGLVLSVGMPAEAGSAGREANAPTAVTAESATKVSVPANVKLTFDRASVGSEAANALGPTTTVQDETTESVPTADAAAADTASVEKEAKAATAEPATAEPATAEPATAGHNEPAAPEPATTAAQPGTDAPKPESKPGTTHASSGNSAVAAAAHAGIGNPYVLGGTSPVTGWDCSGFVQWAYAQAGISVPRTFQWHSMTPTSDPKPGDLVVQNGGSHVGIYVGNGQMISALNPSDGTQLHSVSAMSVSGFYTLP